MRRKDRNKNRLQEHLEQVNLYAAGIDIGSTSHFVAVPANHDDRPVREYSCITGNEIDVIIEQGEKLLDNNRRPR